MPTLLLKHEAVSIVEFAKLAQISTWAAYDLVAKGIVPLTDAGRNGRKRIALSTLTNIGVDTSPNRIADARALARKEYDQRNAKTWKGTGRLTRTSAVHEEACDDLTDAVHKLTGLCAIAVKNNPAQRNAGL